MFTIERNEYENLISELVKAAEPDAFTGNIDPDRFKLALGEFGDIWPDDLFGE